MPSEPRVSTSTPGPMLDSMLRLALPCVLAAVSILSSVACADAAQPQPLDPPPPPSSSDALGHLEPELDPIAQYLARPAPDTAAVREALERLDDGLSAWLDGDHLEGARIVDEALARLPTAGDWRPLIRAELLAAAGDTAGVRRALDDLDPETELEVRWGWELLVSARVEAGDTAAAVRAARDAARRGGTPGAGAAGWIRAGRLALATGDSLGAREALLRALGQGPDSPHARTAAGLLDDLMDPRDDEELLALGRTLLGARAWERARVRLEPLLESGALAGPDHAELRVTLGRGFVELNRPREAERLLESLAGDAVPAELSAPALFWLGRAALARNDAGDAEDAFFRLARRFPGSPLAEEGLLLFMDHLSRSGGLTAPARAMDVLLEIGVVSGAGELVAVRSGTEQYLAGDYSGAATTFERYLEASRRTTTRQQAAYWAALAHGRRGQTDRARELLDLTYREDPLSFYGTFAADRLDAAVLPADLPAGPSPVPGLSRELTNALIRLWIHQKVPTPGSFAHELERLDRHFLRRGDAAYDFAEALLEGGFPIQGVVLGREIHRREGDWNLRLLRIVYPFPYRDAVVREARARGLDPFFVAGLIRQESLFHPSIVSAAGAVGLMQLLPSTAAEVARAEGIRFSSASLSDPDVNLRLGTAFLQSMVRRFGGRAEDALSAYNAGPTRIQQWRQRPEYRDTHVFLEHIPFRETRHYVKVVQQNTRIYTALYGCGDFEPCLGLSYRAAVARSTVAGGAPSSSLAR